MTSSALPRSNARSLILKLFSRLSETRKFQLFLLLLLSIASAFLEVVSLSAVLPLIALATGGASLSTPSQLLAFFDLASLPSIISDNIVAVFSIILIIASVVSGVFRIANLFAIQRVSALVGTDLSSAIYDELLNKPYSYHVGTNSSRIISTLGPQVVRSVLAIASILSGISGLILSSLIILSLFVVNARLALASVALIGLLFALLLAITKKTIRLNSYFIADSEKAQLKALQEGLGSIRDVILDSTQDQYLSYYYFHDRRLRLKRSNNAFLTSLPRYVVDTILVITISVFILAVSLNSGMLRVVSWSSLGFFVLASQKLLPCMQQIFSAVSTVSSYKADLESVLSLIPRKIIVRPKVASLVSAQKTGLFKLSNSIDLKDLSFAYGSSTRDVLKNINLSIRKGSRVGIVGKSGCGKSTFLDILMGLLNPTAGRLEVDGLLVSDSRGLSDYAMAWRSCISHVPQTVYLVDGTIMANIALGISPEEVNIDRVLESARKAELLDLIDSLPDGLSTNVGERGVKLSGGQRQRIGIARALYKKCSILLLDEATSALDDQTEKALMETVGNLSAEMTIVMVSHRVSTLRSCDTFICLTSGAVSVTESFADFQKL